MQFGNVKQGVIKIWSWAEFRRLTETLNPRAIVYNIEQDGLSPKMELTNYKAYTSQDQPIMFLVSRRMKP